jgi:hypothetical protein
MVPEAIFLDCCIVSLMGHVYGGGQITLYTEVRKESVCHLAILKLEHGFHRELMEAHNSSSDEPIIAIKSLIQQDAGRKSHERGTIGDNRTNYGHDPDLFVLRLVRASAYCCLDFREFLEC